MGHMQGTLVLDKGRTMPLGRARGKGAGMKLIVKNATYVDVRMAVKKTGQAILQYGGQKYYELRINGHTWNLPLIQVSEDTWIAYFDSLGDVKLIESSAASLAERMRDCDILLTSESKGIALTHAIAKLLGHDSFIVCRKEVKQSMVNPLVADYRPITSKIPLKLCIDSRFAEKMNGKRVGLVDDIVSTRATIDAMAALAEMAGGTVVRKAAVLVEGVDHPDILHMGVLPIFKKKP